MSASFTPDPQTTETIAAPWFEDARADIAPGYSLGGGQTEEKLKGDIIELLARLGGSDARFMPGRFADRKDGRKVQRAGYLIRFVVADQPAQMQVAGLPIRAAETPDKLRRVKAQALWTVRAQLKAMLSALVFSPGSAPLVQYVLIPGTDHTIAEYATTARGVPNLNPQLTAGGGEP